MYAAYLPTEDERILEHVAAALDSFDQVGDEALLAATFADSAGLWGRADEDWIMRNLAHVMTQPRVVSTVTATDGRR